MDQDDIAFLKAREERRQKLTPEERKIEAMEDLADALYGLVPTLQRLAGISKRR